MRLIDADAEISKLETIIAILEDELKTTLIESIEEPNNNYHNWEYEIEQKRREIRTRKARIRALKRMPTAYDFVESEE